MNGKPILFRVTHILMAVLFFIASYYCLTRPYESLLSFAFFFGVLSLVRGFSYLFMYFKLKKDLNSPQNNFLALGILNIIVGLLFLSNLGAGTLSLAYMFAIWFLFDSIIGLSYSLKFKNNNKFFGLLSILFCLIGIIIAITMFFSPSIAMFSITMLSAYYFLLYGVFEIMLAIQKN